MRWAETQLSLAARLEKSLLTSIPLPDSSSCTGLNSVNNTLNSL